VIELPDTNGFPFHLSPDQVESVHHVRAGLTRIIMRSGKEHNTCLSREDVLRRLRPDESEGKEVLA
jgi:hypothetical protein